MVELHELQQIVSCTHAYFQPLPVTALFFAPAFCCGNPSYSWTILALLLSYAVSTKCFLDVDVVIKVDDGATGLPRQYFDYKINILNLFQLFVIILLQSFVFVCVCDGSHFRLVTLALASSHIVSGLASIYIGLFFVEIWTTLKEIHFGETSTRTLRRNI